MSLGFGFLSYKIANSRLFKNGELLRIANFLTLPGEDNGKEKASKQTAKQETVTKLHHHFAEERLCHYRKCEEAISLLNRYLDVKTLKIRPCLSLSSVGKWQFCRGPRSGPSAASPLPSLPGADAGML